MKLHPGTEWCVFYIPISEDVDDVICCFFMVVCTNGQFDYLIKRTLVVGLKI